MQTIQEEIKTSNNSSKKQAVRLPSTVRYLYWEFSVFLLRFVGSYFVI